MSYPVFNGASVIPLPNLQYADVQFVAQDAVAGALAPWTKQGSFYQFGAQWWEATVTFAAMDRAHIAPWQAFLLQLLGQANVFLLSNPAEANPQGVGFSVVDAQLLNLTPDPGFEDVGSGTWTLPVSTVPYQFTPWVPEAIAGFAPMNQVALSAVTSNNGEVATVKMVSEAFSLDPVSVTSTIYYVSPPSADVTGAVPVISLVNVATGAVIASVAMALRTGGTLGLAGDLSSYVSTGVFAVTAATEVRWEISLTSALSWTSGSFAIGPIFLYAGGTIVSYSGTFNQTPDPGFNSVISTETNPVGDGLWTVSPAQWLSRDRENSAYLSAEEITAYPYLNQLVLTSPSYSWELGMRVLGENFTLAAGTYSVSAYYGMPPTASLGDVVSTPVISLNGTTFSASMVESGAGGTGLAGANPQVITGTFTLSVATTVSWEVFLDMNQIGELGGLVVGPLLVYEASAPVAFSSIILPFNPDPAFEYVADGTWLMPAQPDGLEVPTPWVAQVIPGFSPLNEIVLSPVTSANGVNAEMVSETFSLTPGNYAANMYFACPLSLVFTGPSPVVSLINVETRAVLVSCTVSGSMLEGSTGLAGTPPEVVYAEFTIRADTEVQWVVGVSSEFAWSTGFVAVGPLLVYEADAPVLFDQVKFTAPSNDLTYQSSVDGPPTTTIAIAGAPNSTENFLLPGDNIQIGYRLYKVLLPVNTSYAGTADIVIFPYLRDNPAAGTPISITNCAGLFRMKSNQRGWGTSVQNAWGLDALQLVEAL